MIESGDKRGARTVLVVEDEEDIVKLLRFNLEKEGFIVQSASGGYEALDLAAQGPPDLIILDIMLPELDGLEVCRRLRGSSRTANVPIIMLSARKEELDKVLGLEMGADDYVIKPFSVREVVARVRALMRREGRREAAGENGAEEEPALHIGQVALYPESRRVLVRGMECYLTHKEFELLHLLMANAGKVLTRERLLERIWGFEVEIDTRTVDVHVRYLRQKIEEDPANPRCIETVRGTGYRYQRLSPLQQ